MLVAIDEYNALYWRTQYSYYVTNKKMHTLEPHELRLAAGMRLLERPGSALQNGVVVAASSHSIGAADSLTVPRQMGGIFEVCDHVQIKSFIAFWML